MFPSFNVYCDELQDHRKALESVRDSIKDQFPLLIKESFKGQVDGYFLRRIEDITKTAFYLRSWLEVQKKSLDEIETNTWPELKQRIVHRIEIENAAVELRFLQKKVEYANQLSQVISNDYELLFHAWEERCSDPTLDFAYQYYTPETKLSIGHYDLHPQVGDFSIGFKVTFGGSANGVSDFHIESSSPYAGVAGTVSTAAAASAMGCVSTGPGYPACIGIATAIGAVVAVLVSLFENSKRIGEFNEQQEIIHEIVTLQENAITHEAEKARQLIHSRCNINLPDKILASDSNSVSEIITQLKNDTNSFSKRSFILQQELLSEFTLLQAFFSELLEDLVARKFINIKETYFDSIKSDFRKLLELDIESVKYFSSQVLPVLKQEPSLDRAETLWDHMIEGDVRFNVVPSSNWGSTNQVLSEKIKAEVEND